MSLAGIAPPATTRPHLLAFLGGLAACLLVLLAILPLADGALPGVFAAALVLGIAFVLMDFGFAGSFRALLERGDGRMAGASFAAPAVAALVILPMAGLAEGYGRFVAPVGLSLVLGAALFGIGMQIASGCGSGVLVAAGQGSRRMAVALPFFCVGGVVGSLLLPAALRLPSLGALDLVPWFGPWGGLLVTEALLALAAAAVLRGAWPGWSALRRAAIIGALAALLFLASGMPWGITTELTLWAAQPAQWLGADLMAHEFWQVPWAQAALAGPLLASPSSLANLGLMLGAFLAAAARGQLRHGVALGWRGAAGAALGGLLMGIGARLSFGCNIGAFLGGASSASLHGLAWFLAVLPGCWLGIRLRPAFGLQRV
ncbi:YeeE/YedE thiosulfate transporter family protein [Falsiroseomonas sp.]|uniref:YeeE/YedE thiosulfate transporter family protein n=1 Tax=Falsiroseomonas sp. TaxID=2870721 RepID=UPI0027373D0A|nr:YeeE/YedE thiosulfate transporter family protein [Falsiroseomonas sp.]MDP3418478.1 YeeE/YedE thiosulfate transporter family protein [Falsiroseomonas sp.]